jgi:hypothetical protein
MTVGRESDLLKSAANLVPSDSMEAARYKSPNV